MSTSKKKAWAISAAMAMLMMVASNVVFADPPHHDHGNGYGYGPQTAYYGGNSWFGNGFSNRWLSQDSRHHRRDAFQESRRHRQFERQDARWHQREQYDDMDRH